MKEDSSAAAQLTARQRQWLEHLQQWQAQEQEQGQEVSLKEYALSRGLSVSALYTAKRLFKRRGIWRGREGPGGGRRAAARLVPVRVTGPGSLSAATIRVHFPNGVVLELPEHMEPGRCRALLGALAGSGS